MIRQLDAVFDIERLRDAARTIFDPAERQLSLTHRPGAADPWRDGNGSLFDFANNRLIDHERSFIEFNEELKDTYFFEVYQRVKHRSPLGIGRVRLMRLPSHTCYSLHRDFDIRYHIALETSEDCLMLFEPEMRAYRIPADGHLYETDTRVRHTAINAGPHDRIHLVFTTFEQ